jgi:heterodisulfide reductase subunit A
MFQRIGVYICECGPNIKDAVDMAELVAGAGQQEDVVRARSFGFFCSPEGRAFLEEEIRANNLTRIVIAGCSPKEHGQTFQEVLKGVGLNPYLLQMANIREQCSWVIPEKDAATRKAGALIRGAIDRVRLHEPLHSKTMACCPDVLVVGAGVAGISAALAVARKNRNVYLMEKEPCIGGRVARHEDLFPDMSCASCVIAPQQDTVLHHDNIQILTLTRLLGVVGYLGNFEVTLREKPRFVDMDACIGCGACFEVCPVSVAGPSGDERGGRKAIYIPYGGALPNVAVIDEKSCLRFQGGSCGACAQACPFGAIQYDQTDTVRELHVGAVVVATGFSPFDPGRDERYGYGRIKNIITSLEFEQLVNSTGPTEGKILLADGRTPEKIAFVHCVGSMTEKFNDYCSGVCCLYTLKHAHQARAQLPEAGIVQFHGELCLSGKDAHRFYRKVANEDRIDLFRMLRPDSIEIQEGSGGIAITHTDTAGKLKRNTFDMVVLATAMEGAEGTAKMAGILDLNLGKNGFFEEADACLDPVASARDGIFVAGCAQGPKDIPASVAQGHAAAGKIMEKLPSGKELVLEPMVCDIDQEICSGCLICKRLCPFKAIVTEACDSVVSINEALCRGCGLCAAACPSGAVTARHFTTAAIFQEMRGLLE